MEDREIVELYLNRNEEAILTTSEKYGAYCRAIAKNILGNHDDAMECVNDAYLNLWNSIPPNRSEVLRTYLGRIVRNLSINRYRKNRAEKRGNGETALVLDELAKMIASGLLLTAQKLIMSCFKAGNIRRPQVPL